ncbi:alpha/beta hydrolase [Georgenia daeguensis]|uniref:AB hydrolase-1 domain-containing protein n=1 Tax=Georgenia daeguensis TaxID=908355 RepID=A0ABP8EPE3_9MICO
MSTHTYGTVDVPVDGGTLRAGVWEPVDPAPGAPTVLAVHGITATHLAWTYLVDALPGVRVVAPDLRGRGRSNALPGPFGMARHADDLAAVLRHLGTGPVVVVGHSMGAFASAVLAHRHGGLVESLVLVDGGLPLEVPAGADPDELMRAVLGPAAARLAMTFRDHEAYRDFWRRHPAFAGQVSERLGEYFDYDLEPADGAWRPSSRLEAVTGDQRELVTGESLLPALEALQTPTLFLRAPRGLLDGEPLYTAEHVARWAARLPVATAEVPDVNHYTIVMGPAGAAAVADRVRAARAEVSPS